MKKIYFLSLALIFTSVYVFAQNASLTEAEKIALDQQQIEMELSIKGEIPIDNNKPMVQYGQTGNKGPFDLYVEIGNGTAGISIPSSRFPFYNLYENNRCQTLYLAGELTGVETITGIEFDFEQIAAAPENDMLNFVVNILPVSDNVLTTGDFYDMSSATEVFNEASYIPATTTGYNNIIDIDDFVYNGTDNLIIEIIWGDNNEYTFSYFRNYKTDGGVIRTLYGYADSETPPVYDDATSYFSNIRFYYEASAPPPPPTVPLSNWAFAIIGILALTFVFIKFRK